MLEQLFHGLNQLLCAPVLALAAHGAAFWYARRKAAQQAAVRYPHQPKDRQRHLYHILRYLLPAHRVGALYAVSFAAMALVAALEARLFSLNILFGLLFFCSALAALHLENQAKRRRKLMESDS